MWATSVIFKKMHKVNNNPLGNYLGENSPNLVTLPVSSPIFLSASLPFLFFLHYIFSILFVGGERRTETIPRRKIIL
jgi:hypothetical protein